MLMKWMGQVRCEQEIRSERLPEKISLPLQYGSFRIG